MTDELKPVRCGCGGEAWMSHGKSDGQDDCMIVCIGCGIATRYYDSEAEAITAWNRAMSERMAKVTTVEKPIIGSAKTISVMACENCENVVSIFDSYCSGCGAKLEWG